MKSDREFLEGVYEKAAKMREQAPAGDTNPSDTARARRNGRIAHFPKIAAACAAVLVLCVGVTAFGLLPSSHDTEEKPGTETRGQAVRTMPTEETDAGAPAAARFSLDSPENQGSEFVLTGCTLEGNVSGVSGTDKEGRTVEISEAAWLSGAPDGEPETVSVRYSETDEYGRMITFQADEQVLLFLNAKEEEGGLVYYLANGAESKYVFWKEEDGLIYYQNSDGTVIDRGAFKQE